MQKIIRNSVKCHVCDTEVESKHRHDFVWCKCGNIAVDGGKDYLKRVGAFRDGSTTDTSIVEEVVKRTRSEIVSDIGHKLKGKTK